MQVLFTNPIVHNGVEYGRGVAEVDDNLGAFLVKTMPWAAEPFSAPPAAVIAKAPDAPPTPDPLEEEDALEAATRPDNKKKK